MREYFCAYHSMLGATRRPSDAELGRLFRALLHYSECGEPPSALRGRAALMFDVFSQQIDRDAARYEAKCRQMRAKASKCRQMPADAGSGAQDKDKGKDKGKDKDEDKGKDEDKDEVPFVPRGKKKKDDLIPSEGVARARAREEETAVPRVHGRDAGAACAHEKEAPRAAMGGSPSAVECARAGETPGENAAGAARDVPPGSRAPGLSPPRRPRPASCSVHTTGVKWQHGPPGLTTGGFGV